VFQNQNPRRPVAEPITAYRFWVVRAEDGMLFSHNSAPWPVTGIQATCTVHVQTPANDHTCGIYAAKELTWLYQHYKWMLGTPDLGPYVIGKVRLWGHVIVATDGYRAEWAEPYLLYYTKQYYDKIRKAALLYSTLLEPLAPPDLGPSEEELRRARAEAMRERRAETRALNAAIIAELQRRRQARAKETD